MVFVHVHKCGEEGHRWHARVCWGDVRFDVGGKTRKEAWKGVWEVLGRLLDHGMMGAVAHA